MFLLRQIDYTDVAKLADALRQVVFLLRQIDIKDYTNNTVVAKTADCFDAANDRKRSEYALHELDLRTI